MFPCFTREVDRIAEAFSAVPRRLFLPRGARWRAGLDAPILIGYGQTNSQPRTVAAMLSLLEVRPGDRVLDVGSGSGWTTALLAHLTGPDGEVIGVEIEPELVSFGAANLDRSARPWASIVPAEPGVLGLPERAPYDRILVSAMAEDLPHQLADQLAVEGRMVAPVAGRMLLVRRCGADLEVTTHGEYRFVPLR